MTEEAVAAAAEAGADALGFVFIRDDSRWIEPARAWDLVSSLPPLMTSVGVFRNASIDEFCDVEEACPTAMSQLHGTEPEKVVRECGPGVIKTVRFEGATFEEDLRRWNEVEEVDAILIDVPAGGAPDWAAVGRAVARVELAKPVLLSGGLNASNVGEAIRAVRPYGVDVSAGVERAAGVKDAELIEAFCAAVREADAR